MISQLTYLLTCIILHITFASSQLYEFCSDNQLFSFTKEKCPGGVIFKTPVKLTEPCHCINKYLTAYSKCDMNLQADNLTSSRKICKPMENYKRKHDPVFIKLVQPITQRIGINKPVKFRHGHKDSKCKNIHRKCSKNTNSFSVTPFLSPGPDPPKVNISHSANVKPRRKSLRWRRFRKPHHSRQKRQVSSSNTADEKLRERIQEAMELLNELQFGNIGFVKPKSMSFQLLAKTITIYNDITPNVIVEDEVVHSVLTLFLKKYADMELPGYSGRLIVDDQVDRGMFENVMGSLTECASRASDSTQEFEFVTTSDACPPDITHVVHKVNTLEAGFKRAKYELGKFMPEDRKYVPEKEDFILGALWKVFDAVYSYCFTSVFSYRTSQTLNNYFTIISNIFTSPWTVNDYLSDNGQGTLTYSSRIEHGNLTDLMKNLDYMTEAVHMLSRYKTFFRKPVSKDGSVERPKREQEPEIEGPVTTTSESPIFRNRNKRSISDDKGASSNWAELEIWDGRAYCLQVANPNLPLSIANVFPNIESLCKL